MEAMNQSSNRTQGLSSKGTSGISKVDSPPPLSLGSSREPQTQRGYWKWGPHLVKGPGNGGTAIWKNHLVPTKIPFNLVKNHSSH